MHNGLSNEEVFVHYETALSIPWWHSAGAQGKFILHNACYFRILSRRMNRHLKQWNSKTSAMVWMVFFFFLLP